MDTQALKGSLDDEIYLGFWINRSIGTIRGATLTLDRGSGGVLIAFLALYVTASGRGFWKLLRCLLHFVYSSPSPPDGIHLQRQATLRNTPLALDAALEFLDISWTWRAKTTKLECRPLVVATIALVSAVGFLVTGLFSSRVSSSSANEVLISGRYCNIDLPGNMGQNLSNWQYIIPFLNQRSAEHLAYASRCYQEGPATQPDGCKALTIPALPYRMDRNASCPFAEEMCKSSFGNLIIDTGPLDSFEHFGLNKKPRLTVWGREHCAPLSTEGFRDTFVAPQQPDVAYMRYSFGGGDRNFTFETVINASTTSSGLGGDYEVYAIKRSRARPFIPQLQVENGYTTLLFLVPKNIAYLNRTEDPWFSATTIDKLYSGLLYNSDQPASVLGCVTERRVCNPDLPASTGCVDTFSRNMSNAGIERAWPNAQDRIWLRPLAVVAHSFGSVGIASFFDAKGVPNLLARQTLVPSNFFANFSRTLQAANLPINQWQQEIEYVSQANLAAMQHFIVDYARGAWLDSMGLCDHDVCRRLCYSQKVRSSRHYSFSVLGLFIIFTVGGILVLLATLLDTLLAVLFRFQRLRRNARLSHAYAEWQVGSTLQLQRIAHESLGAGTWVRATEEVPITQSGHTLAVLDITDRNHPRLIHSQSTLHEVDVTKAPMGKRGAARCSKVPTMEYAELI